MKWKIFVLIVAGVLAAQACSSIAPPASMDQSNSEAAVVGGTETAIAGLTGETPSAAVPVTFKNISFIIPAGLATGANPQEMPAVGSAGAPWEIAPAYTKVTLTGYPLQGKLFEPHILVYPASEYEATDHPSAAQTLDRLRVLISEPDLPANDGVPGAPMFNAAKVFGSQIAKVNMQNVAGVRLLTEYAQGISPISNLELVYQFQGLTSDGKYYIIANLPVNVSFLAADENPASPIPAEGVPFPDLDNADAGQINAYVQTVADRLNATSPDSFQPTLAQLDALIQSINVSP